MQGSLQAIPLRYDDHFRRTMDNVQYSATMQEPASAENDSVPKRSTSQETLSDEEFFDCTDGGNLSPSSLKDFLRKVGAPTELPNNNDELSQECSVGSTCGLCTKLKIPPKDQAFLDVTDSSGVFLSANDDVYSCDSGSPIGTNTPQSPQSPDLLSPSTSGASTPRRRKPSLKSPNAPDTPRRKSVRFADALGLDLETVKHILENEVSPDYPNFALAASQQDGNTVTLLPRYLSLNFQQPGGQHDFISRVYKQNVCLENAVVSDFTILGTVKVRNLGFHKTVKIRYSCDGWHSFGDVPASYVHGSCDGPMDRFSFGLSAPRDIAVGQSMEFAVCFISSGTEYWDNNFGHNYCLECVAQAETLNECPKFWTHFL